jgi:hypothetical protein
MYMSESQDARIQAIEKRNQRVELDKAWEMSWTRRVFLALLTYVVVLLYSYLIHASHPWLQSLVPVVGFLISTLTISAVKEWWVKNGGQKRK